MKKTLILSLILAFSTMASSEERKKKGRCLQCKTVTESKNPTDAWWWYQQFLMGGMSHTGAIKMTGKVLYGGCAEGVSNCANNPKTGGPDNR